MLWLKYDKKVPSHVLQVYIAATFFCANKFIEVVLL